MRTTKHAYPAVVAGVDSDREARHRRIEKLSETLGASSELCGRLDEAVEFAALEGSSVAEALAGFIEDGRVPLAGYKPTPVDIASLRLPVIPKQMSRLVRTSSENTSAAELERIVNSDPVLAGKLLGAANSASSGSGFEIVSILDAVMRLGVPEARRVLLRSCFAGLFASRPLQDLWEHSQMVAETAYDLAVFAEPSGGIDPDTAYLAGLLHDIGRLAFLKLPAKQRILDQKWMAAGFPAVYAETMAYGMDHAALGAACLRDWELPESIVEAVRMHHRPEVDGSSLSALLSLAEDVTARTSNVASEDLWPAMRRTAACFTIGITLDQFGEFTLGRMSLSRACA